MGMGFRLNLKWVFSVQSSFLTNSSSWPSSYSFRDNDVSYDSARISFPSVNFGEIETLCNDLPRANTCSSATQTLENEYSKTEEIKASVGESCCGGLCNLIDDNIQMPTGEDKLTFLASLQASKASIFSLLMENVDMLEKTFADSDVVRLERDILVQLERLGALKLFHTFLSRTLKSPALVDLSDAPTELVQEPPMNGPVDDHMATIVVQSGKKEERKSRRERASEKVYTVALPSKAIHKDAKQLNFSSARRSSNSSGRRLKITRNETEMSLGVKLVANLERIRSILEEETGQIVSLSSWAEAAGVDKMVLQKNLHFGWCCRDELLRSTRSLVMYLARNYRGLGLAFEDLIQAGNSGVLQGAERFDHTRGYKFSTYVQYWIRKSMSMLTARHARGVRIPFTLSKAISQIQKARKALHYIHGRYTDDDEIAKFTGLSLAKIASASKCLRVVGSIDQKIGDFSRAKFLEFTPDSSIKNPEEIVMRQHMVNDIYDLMSDLDLRERQVLILRFGLGDHQQKSLEEIGKRFGVSKEWIRRIEKTALTKLRDAETLQYLSHYLHM